MKKLVSIILMLFVTVSIAQNGINYKALIKDDNGNVLSSVLVSIQFIIYEGQALTNNVYQENHTINTDANGFVMVNIGDGTTSDDFTSINWANNEHYLNVQVDIGSGLVDLGTTQFMAVPYALNAEKATIATNVSGLEAINEGNGIGHRIIGRNPDYYGAIGNRAMDLSYSSSNSNSHGATGNFSFAAGNGSESSGLASLAIGNSCVASLDKSTAIGNETRAEGLFSTAIGSNSEASDSFAVAIGNVAKATGESATALGKLTTASGKSATAFGLSTLASAENSTALGSYSKALSLGSVAIGYFSETNGTYATALGAITQASGFASTAMGYETIASGTFSTALGFDTNASSYGETVIGRYNANYTPISNTSWNNNDRLFIIGNGSSAANRTNALTVIKNGNIGISTVNPKTKLHITNGTDTGLDDDDGYLLLGNTNSINVSMDDNEIMARNNGNPSNLNLQIEGGNVLVGGAIQVNHVVDSGVAMRVNNDEAIWYNGTYFSWGFGGQRNYFADEVGIGTITPSASLDVIGSIEYTGDITDVSDRRLKENFKDIKDPLERIIALKGYSYNMINDESKKREFGVIAQELQKIFPEMVSVIDTKNNYLGVSYIQLIPLLIEALKEQNKIIVNQSNRIKSLENRNKEISDLKTEILVIKRLLAISNE